MEAIRDMEWGRIDPTACESERLNVEEWIRGAVSAKWEQIAKEILFVPSHWTTLESWWEFHIDSMWEYRRIQVLACSVSNLLTKFIEVSWVHLWILFALYNAQKNTCLGHKLLGGNTVFTCLPGWGILPS